MIILKYQMLQSFNILNNTYLLGLAKTELAILRVSSTSIQVFLEASLVAHVGNSPTLPFLSSISCFQT